MRFISIVRFEFIRWLYHEYSSTFILYFGDTVSLNQFCLYSALLFLVFCFFCFFFPICCLPLLGEPLVSGWRPPGHIFFFFSLRAFFLFFNHNWMIIRCQKSCISYLYNTDTSVKETLGSVPLASVLKRIDYLKPRPGFLDFHFTVQYSLFVLIQRRQY